MKTIIKWLFAAALFSGFSSYAHAQGTSDSLVVIAHVKETKGTYDQRKIYRGFLKDYINDCPYIRHFSVHEAAGSDDNHKVIWTYEVSSWNDIIKFYSWIRDKMKLPGDNGFKKALTPYQPDYSIGGQIHVEEKREMLITDDQMAIRN